MLGFYDCPSVSTWSYLEDMGKMHQSPNVKLVGIPGPHVLLLVMRHDIEDAMRTARVRAVIMVV